jgi:hypothetical protein
MVIVDAKSRGYSEAEVASGVDMMNYPLTPEQAALYAVARTTWRRRGNAKARRLSFGEESITETILMDLAETFPGSLSIVPFSKPEEGKVGPTGLGFSATRAARTTFRCSSKQKSSILRTSSILRLNGMSGR